MVIRILPKQALTRIMNLIGHFNFSLGREIKFYQKYRDADKFKRVLGSLSGDLSYFVNNFESWNQSIKTSDERRQLRMLQEHLDQAKNLVAKAARLVDETHE